MKSFLSFRLGCVIALAGLLGPAIASAQPYTVTIDLTAGILYSTPGNPLPQDNLVLLIADTGLNGFGAFTPGNSLNLGSYLNGDDQIIGVASINDQGGSLPEGFAEPPSFADIPVGDTSGTYSRLANGDPLALVWFSNLTSSSTVLTAGSYGLYTTSSPTDGSDSWVIPPLGDSAIDLKFQTMLGGGPNPETDGDANLTAVPEPATYSLIAGAAALLAGLAYSRKRSPLAG